MPQISRTRTFVKQFAKLAPTVQNTCVEKISIFTTNPRHPGLRTEKLGGGNFWSFRVDRNFRVIFEWEADCGVTLLYVATHDVYRKLKRL